MLLTESVPENQYCIQSFELLLTSNDGGGVSSFTSTSQKYAFVVREEWKESSQREEGGLSFELSVVFQFSDE